jgi:hypothetical protein
MANSFLSRRWLFGGLIGVVGVAAAVVTYTSSSTTLKPVVPSEPALDSAGTPEARMQAYDRFSWQEFIALNWPATDSRRGEPDRAKAFGAPAEWVVWGSWKSLGELFPGKPEAHPSEWDDFAADLALPELATGTAAKPVPYDKIPKETAGKVKVLHQAAKLVRFNQAPFASPITMGPLVAQNGRVVRYETRVNRIAYDYIRDNKLYSRKILEATSLNFPAGSIHVKAAWLELNDAQIKGGRFYTIRAKVLTGWTADDAQSPILEDRDVGLVGLHIVHKTEKHPDWIWTTFEHVDNLLAEDGPGTPPATFSCQKPPAAIAAANQSPPAVERGNPFPTTPVEVARMNPIDPATDKINAEFQGHPQVAKTVWRNYKLVGTQRADPGTTTRPPAGDESKAIPKALANTTLETYFQQFSCLGCHEQFNRPNPINVRARGDFAFYPQVMAAPRN